MTGLLTIRDSIRDFLRKYDEITTPLIRFVIALIVFKSVNSMYGYSDLFDKGVVIFLLAVISALVSDIVVVLLVGATMCINAFAVSLEVGVLFLLMFILMYCLYMRMFPDCSWILILVPVLYTLKIQYAVPIIVAIFVGLSGAVPAAFGIVIFYFSKYVKEVYDTLHATVTEEHFQPLTYIVKGLSKNKEMMVAAIVFAIVIVITNTIHRLSFDYAWYVAIGVGALCNIICFIICGTVLDAGVGGGEVVLGTLLGLIIAVVIQMCKSIVDYSKKETVQFEDDEYYYYVKAIPKLGEPSKEKNVKTMTENGSQGRDDTEVKRRLAEHAAAVSRTDSGRRNMEQGRQRSSAQVQNRTRTTTQSQSRQRPSTQGSSRPNPNRK
ncbi:MAG: hypothetical protein K2G45_04185 [Lachnospiraceae bacterium]|nr:hypothetical protein [Lachnospiraceae bacterium]